MSAAAVVATVVAAAAGLAGTRRHRRVLGRLPVDRPGWATWAAWLPPVPQRATGWLAAGRVPTTPSWPFWMAALGLVGLVCGSAAIGGPGLAGVAAASSATAAVAGRRWWRSRDEAGRQRTLAPALELVAGSLRSGASLGDALAEAGRATPGPIGDDLRLVTCEALRSGDLAAALGRWEAADGSSDVRLAVAALALGLSTGGARAQAIDGVAATIRARLDARAEAWALATQGRLSATVLAAAPVAFCVLAAAGGGGTASFLLRTRPGLACLAGGLSLDGLGAAWMARLTRLSVT